MQSDDTINWVKQNQAVIRGCAQKHLDYAPYSMEDYMQDANIAALEAYNRHPDTSSTPFIRIFWRLFKDQIISIVPMPPKSAARRLSEILKKMTGVAVSLPEANGFIMQNGGSFKHLDKEINLAPLVREALAVYNEDLKKRYSGNNESMSIPNTEFDNYEEITEAITNSKEDRRDYFLFIYIWARPAFTEKEANTVYLAWGLGNEGILPEREMAKQLNVSRAVVKERLASCYSKIDRMIKEKNNRKILLMMFKNFSEVLHEIQIKGD